MREPQSIWITGASRGLGKALARALASPGHRLALFARGAADLEAVAAAARAAGAEAHALAGDLGDPVGVAALAARAGALVGPPDLLVLNASSLGPVPLPKLADLPARGLEEVFALNVFGHFRLLAAATGPMVLRGAGTVLAISSDAAVEAYPGWGAYGASKAAFDHLVRVHAVERFAGSGVRVLAADPGEMDTVMHAAAVPEADPRSLRDPGAVAAGLLAALADPGGYPSGTRFAVRLPARAEGSA